MTFEDRIEIKDLLVRGIIGVHAWERNRRQDILLNLTLFVDLRAAGQSDDLADTVDYSALSKQVIAHVESVGRRTVEALAADVARICVAAPGVLRARVRVEKPGAVRFSRSVGVEIERAGSDFA